MSDPVWVDLPEAMAIHEHMLAEHGGSTGLRDGGLLESALARPKQLLAYGDPDIFDLAAAYTSGIVLNHPFVDGNKRTGFVVGILFLELDGPAFNAPETDATRVVLDLAAGNLSDEDYAVWLRENTG